LTGRRSGLDTGYDHWRRNTGGVDEDVTGQADGEGVTSFDAGWMGCDVLPTAFRRQMQSVAVGEVVEFTMFDPSAKEDLPSLARMMGHKIVRSDERDDGALTVSVERGR
jgi:TusA-related sulfurtransferase